MHSHKTSEGFFNKKQKNYNQISLNTSDIMINTPNYDNYHKALNMISMKKAINKSLSAERTVNTVKFKLMESKTPAYSLNNMNFLQNNMKKKIVNIHQNYKLINKKPDGSRSKSGSRGSISNNSSNTILNDIKSKKYNSYISALNISNISNNDKGNSNISSISSKRLKRTISTEQNKENINNTSIIKKNDSNINLDLAFLQDLTDQPNDKTLRDLIHTFQLRDAIHRQEINKLKGSNDYLISNKTSLEMQIERLTKTHENVN